MLIDFHTHLDFYKDDELQSQLAEFSGTIVAASIDEFQLLEFTQMPQTKMHRFLMTLLLLAALLNTLSTPR